MLATVIALYNLRRGRSPRPFLRKVVSARMSSTRTNNSSSSWDPWPRWWWRWWRRWGRSFCSPTTRTPPRRRVSCSTTSGTTTCTYGSTGEEDTFVVPEGVSSVHVVATGASGAAGRQGARAGGRGAVVSGDLTGLTAGDTLYVNVGGAPTGGRATNCARDVDCIGGFNGGGKASVWWWWRRRCLRRAHPTRTGRKPATRG